MRHGWVYIYGSPPVEARFKEIVEILSKKGIFLERPGSGEVARVSTEGERIVSSEQDILKELQASHDVPIQLYLDESTGIFCSIEKLGPDVIRESYSLDGKTEEESLDVIQSLIELFSYRAKHATAFAIVVDKFAELHRDFHWDDFVLGNTVPPEWPMFLGFSKNFHIPKNLPSSYALSDKGSYLSGGTLNPNLKKLNH
ncbi:MAG: hypothetical protein JSS69_07460 [Acidobacteria bacterium]|nr:hypothetical protein [Acidobacteriota bacterium]MBS1865740.1 hypothetical protein [Acidobacteriota bacterium]